MTKPNIRWVAAAVAMATSNLAMAQVWRDGSRSADERAAAYVSDLTLAEKVRRIHGELAMPILGFTVPEGALGSAGFIPGDAARGLPALQMTDASLGVANPNNVRPGDGGTAMPSGLVSASTWNRQLSFQGGQLIGKEAWSKGFNVLLAGGINLARDPRNGRNFEYLGEDPLLAGVLGGEAIRGIQSQHVLSTIKHFAMNNQEASRFGLSANIGEAAMRESDLLAFQIAMEIGQPGAVMCGYNRVNSVYACDHDHLLNQILKKQWGYKGFVMSDWGATHSLASAMNGIDMEMGTQMDKILHGDVWFDQPMLKAAASDDSFKARLQDMNQRILRSVFDVGLFDHPPVKSKLDMAAHATVAQRVAEEGVVLLKNEGALLPIREGVKKILVIGGHADKGVLSGGGSSQVLPPEGPAVLVHTGGEGIFAGERKMVWHKSSPLAALKARYPKASITFNDGRYPSEAAMRAKDADLVIVFATQWMMEAFDVLDLSLPDGQDALITQVAQANPKTVVVLETGGPVAMPWLKQVPAVVAAWYPGAKGGEAISGVLSGDVNPSGRLPVTFPASLSQLPRPAIPGFGLADMDKFDVDYRIEGANVGYRWFAKQQLKPLYPFGHGLSYTQFQYSDLKVKQTSPLTVSFTVQNVGKISGADVPQLYLLARPGETRSTRLLGWDKLVLNPGERKTVELTVDDRLLSAFDEGAKQWHLAQGDYRFMVGHSAAEAVLPGVARVADKRFLDRPVSR